jgi:hypothetical protein
MNGFSFTSPWPWPWLEDERPGEPAPFELPLKKVLSIARRSGYRLSVKIDASAER